MNIFSSLTHWFKKWQGRAPLSPWRIITAVGLCTMIVCTIIVIGGAVYLFYGGFGLDDEDGSVSLDGSTTSTCNVYREKLHGTLDVFKPPEGSENFADIVGSDDIVFNIELAAKDPSVKGVLLDIDSTGGYAVAADEIAKALKALNKPSVAVIRGFGDSAAYWAATGANVIIASPLSDVGSIGVTQSYLENAEHNEKEGFTYRQLSLGKYKDMGSPDKTLTAEEKEIVMKQLEYGYDYFIKTVATNRDIPIEEVKKVATGQSFTGVEALELKLIDKLGGLPEATAWLATKIGAQPEYCY